MGKTKLGVTLFLFSESIFFIILILTYVLYHGRNLHGLSTSQFLNVRRTGSFTVLLLFSSFTMWLAMRSLRKQNHGRMGFWLLSTLGLGIAFLYGQSTEWLGLIHQNLTVSRDLFGATFFTLTGFHGFHVFVGLILITITLLISWLSPGLRPTSEAVDSVSLYWHFVDGVWIAVFTVIYLATV